MKLTRHKLPYSTADIHTYTQDMESYIKLRDKAWQLKVVVPDAEKKKWQDEADRYSVIIEHMQQTLAFMLSKNKKELE